MDEEAVLTPKDISNILSERLERYKDLNLLETFSIFMGKCQLLEIALKNLLIMKFNKDKNTLTNSTLGKTKGILEQAGLRKDFLVLLGNLKDKRNYIAHELLANEMLVNEILGHNKSTMEERILLKAVHELEQVIIVYDWCKEHDAWT